MVADSEPDVPESCDKPADAGIEGAGVDCVDGVVPVEVVDDPDDGEGACDSGAALKELDAVAGADDGALGLVELTCDGDESPDPPPQAASARLPLATIIRSFISCP